jgi:hypothetical protein
MANRKGLGKSRKFFEGAVHENGTGKFVILNRYEGEDGRPWLEFEWQTGAKAGEIEQNSEMNINSSIHKFQINRKAAGEEVVIKQGEATGGSVMERLEEALIWHKQNNQILNSLAQFVFDYNERQDGLMAVITKQAQVIDSLKQEIDRLVLNSNIMSKQQEMMDKLINKIPS